jgi:hypothetical protein
LRRWQVHGSSHDGAEEALEGGERQGRLGLQPGRAQDLRIGRLGRDLLEKGRLSQTGAAADDQARCLPRASVVQQLHQSGRLDVAAM